MSEPKSYKWAYRRRTWSFSLSCIAIVLLSGVSLATYRDLGIQLNDISVLVVGVVAALIYLLKRLIWRCPACGYSFEMRVMVRERKDPAWITVVARLAFGEVYLKVGCFQLY